MEIAEILNMIADGIDPTTGEMFDNTVFEQDDTRAAYDRLKACFRKGGKRSRYKELCEKYPGHIVLVKSGFFYSAYYESAEILGQVMGYKVAYIYDGKVAVTGGPDLCIIADGLHSAGLSYVAINKGEVEDMFDGKNPFI